MTTIADDVQREIARGYVRFHSWQESDEGDPIMLVQCFGGESDGSTIGINTSFLKGYRTCGVFPTFKEWSARRSMFDMILRDYVRAYEVVRRGKTAQDAISKKDRRV